MALDGVNTPLPFYEHPQSSLNTGHQPYCVGKVVAGSRNHLCTFIIHPHYSLISIFQILRGMEVEVGTTCILSKLV